MTNDAISRTDLIRKLQAWDAKANGIPNYVWGVINELPSVTLKEKDSIYWVCQNCGLEVHKDYKHCPRCGEHR